MSLPDTMPSNYADKRMFRWILLNLLANAVNFMRDGGEVMISTETALGGVTIIVVGTWTGAAPQALSHLTKPFKRGESNPYRVQTGQDLGLVITKSLVDLYGGSLTINSGVSVGGAVKLCLPGKNG